MSSLHTGIWSLNTDTQRVCYCFISVLLIWWQNLFNSTIFRIWSELMITFQISTKSEPNSPSICIIHFFSKRNSLLFLLHALTQDATAENYGQLMVCYYILHWFWSDEKHIFHLTIFRMKWVYDYSQSVSTIWYQNELCFNFSQCHYFAVISVAQYIDTRLLARTYWESCQVSCIRLLLYLCLTQKDDTIVRIKWLNNDCSVQSALYSFVTRVTYLWIFTAIYRPRKSIMVYIFWHFCPYFWW